MIEKDNSGPADALPKSYHILESRALASLLKTMASIGITIPTKNLSRRSATIRNLPRHSETTPGGQERVTDTARLARLNLAVHGLSGEWSGATWTLPKERPEGERGGAHQIKQGNKYYEDLQTRS